jgi:multidrug efflux system membrane fusion protein
MVVTAKAVLAQRQREFDAVSRLVKSGSSPKLEQDTAQSALATAQSQLEQAIIELDRLQLRAPFAGIIDRVDVDEGDYLQEGAPVAVLLQLDPIIAKAEVSEHDMALVNVGDPADVRLVSGETITGVVRHISREASAQTRTFPVEVSLPNPQHRISSGLTAEIILRGKAVKSVLLPRSVVTLSEQGDLGIRIINKDDQVGFVPIELIDDTPEGLYLGGISTDARIIVAGQDLVSDGDQVNVVETDTEVSGRLPGTAIEVAE